jgi:hypothetical protein
MSLVDRLKQWAGKEPSVEFTMLIVKYVIQVTQPVVQGTIGPLYAFIFTSTGSFILRGGICSPVSYQESRRLRLVGLKVRLRYKD